MGLTITFALSGTIIAVLIAAKRIEEKHGRTFILLQLISRSNHKVCELSHGLVAFYAHARERFIFMLEKQLPLYARSYWNKLSILAVEAGKKYVQKIRDAKFLHKRKDGMSEFLGKLNEVEKGNGEINETLEDGSQEVGNKVE